MIYIRHITLAHGFQWTCWLKITMGTIVGGEDMERFLISSHIIIIHVRFFHLIIFQNVSKNAGIFLYFTPYCLICGYILLAAVFAIHLVNPNRMKSTEGVQWLPEPTTLPLSVVYLSLFRVNLLVFSVKSLACNFLKIIFFIALFNLYLCYSSRHLAGLLPIVLQKAFQEKNKLSS